MASQATVRSPLKSPARRVLGSLTPKAINTPQKHLERAAGVADVMHHSPLKQVQTLSPHVYMDAENQPPPTMLNAARKRSIYEVEGVEDKLEKQKQQHTRQGLAGRGSMVGVSESMVGRVGGLQLAGSVHLVLISRGKWTR
jgi:hypothetical protein